jgi:hypothetical protein
MPSTRIIGLRRIASEIAVIRPHRCNSMESGCELSMCHPLRMVNPDHSAGVF